VSTRAIDGMAFAPRSRFTILALSQERMLMFQHIKDLQFDARVSQPDPRFARIPLDQFGGGNGGLKAAMQYFVQAFG